MEALMTQLAQVLHMNQGNGETSYARNSAVGRKAISIAKPVIEEAVLKILGSDVMGIESMGIADLGCSSGPNTFLLMSHIINVIHTRFRTGLDHPSPVTELRVYLNDLFSTDFNSIFMSLPSFYTKLKQDYDNGRDSYQHLIHPLISAVPGSFYGPLFPRKSMHFVHSSFSLHWLSQISDGLNNKGKICISKSSPQRVLDAYSMQFQKDFSVFLSSRAQEIVNGGRMVLSFLARPSTNPTAEHGMYVLELLAHALMAMASNGLIKEEKVDSFNMPCYAPCAEDLIMVLQKEGSFITDRLEAFEVDWDTVAPDDLDHDQVAFDDDDDQVITSGQQVANNIRVVTESILEPHFGKEMMDDLFQKYAEEVSKHLSSCVTRPKYTVLVISLIRNF
ncbi:hypothetical protein ACLB2K_033731 [Fragaria x ananassa]